MENFNPIVLSEKEYYSGATVLRIKSLEDFYFKSARFFSLEYRKGNIQENLLHLYLNNVSHYFNATSNIAGMHFVLRQKYTCDVFTAFKAGDISLLDYLVPKIKELILQADISLTYQPSYSRLLASLFHRKALLCLENKSYLQANRALLESKKILEELVKNYPSYYKAKDLLNIINESIPKIIAEIELAFQWKNAQQ